MIGRTLYGVVCGVFLLCARAAAEQLPLKSYTTADGLAHNDVVRIVRDSRGFLWICTRDGLSRFDGHVFKTYTTADGLPHQSVRDVLETRDGEYWIATAAGLARMIPRRTEPGAPLFSHYSPERDQLSRNVRRLLQDSKGIIRIATFGGLFQLERASDRITFRYVDLQLSGDRVIESLFEDRRGALWIGTRTSFLYRRWPDGRVEHFTRSEGLPDSRVTALVAEDDGTLWVGTTAGLAQLVREPVPGRPMVARVYTVKDGLADNWIGALVGSPDGAIWVASGGLSRVAPAADGTSRTVRAFKEENGVPLVATLALDRGDLWLGTSVGVLRLNQGGMNVYRKSDGLGTPVVGSIFTTRNGDVCVFGNDRFARFNGTRFVSIALNYGRRIIEFPWDARHIALQDRSGDIWLATGNGLCRFPRVDRLEDLSRARPRKVYGIGRGLDRDFVFLVYEDRHDDIWILTGPGWPWTLTRWDRATDTFYAFSERDGWRTGTHVADLTESSNGDLWIAAGALVRYRDGRFTFFTTDDGLPSDDVTAVHIDSRGRLWAATDTAGVIRIDDPAADRPDLRIYTTREQLASNQVLNVVEDREGRLYFVTSRGLDRLDVETNEVRHYTIADGLTTGPLAFRDSNGALWFGSNHELSRLVPGPDTGSHHTSVWISGVSIGGVARPLAELGVTELPALELTSGDRQVDIEFFGIGQRLRYQYRLEASAGEWSKPTSDRAVHYANLAAGRYRFQVRAIGADGKVVSEPATMAFVIPPPIWLRWWFLTIAAAVAAAGIYAIYRARLQRALAIERVRTRIATDLHDDLGASLSRVSILSEVVKQRLDPVDDVSASLLGEIADASRGVVGSLRDTVWAIDARHDTLGDLASRVRQFASTIFDGRGIAWKLEVMPDATRLPLDSEQRRHILLFFKEAIHNIARHADCRTAELSIGVQHHDLICRVGDRGRGFDVSVEMAAAAARGSRGLESMPARAAHLGGRLEIHSAPADGTLLTLTVPLKRRMVDA
jgi:ligand-binding sensor domain-containing protein/signal transduction histidine kinase